MPRVLVPELIGGLAVFALAAALVFALLKLTAARGLALGALVLAGAAVILAAETEARYRSCTHAHPVMVKYRPSREEQIDAALNGTRIPDRVSRERTCERWPW